jgi:hypothetical protein
MQSSSTTYQLIDFTARREGWQYKVYAIIFSIVFVLLLIYFYSQSLAIEAAMFFPVALFGFISAFFWYKILDKRIKLTINKDGIRFKSRKVIPWDIIQRFYFKGRHHKVSSYWLYVETTQHYKAIRINISDLDKTYHHIADAIKNYGGGFNIEYCGITNYVP